MLKGIDKSILGWGISLVIFLVIMVVDQTVYVGVWPSTLPVVLLVTHALYFKEDNRSEEY
ncbi:hypothetical protein G3A_13790 [Bacillus sp. 17376]|uniref:Uncharacterized protein n=1 Tax=Mesobacillus boroniphilus JCM 21738 TaxID=1294265 RepID=W4RNV1_9BACI|nr:hypothetical protein [Mesobacillus boroniphilus]ESU31973.1 hypothetical protein G3A_13790 [Bacillus sp. 17376]GAE45543.1 hypothetical protein JCM21738_2361 [Mesobacillus boroniphilus JCM 21738]